MSAKNSVSCVGIGVVPNVLNEKLNTLKCVYEKQKKFKKS